MAGVTAVVWVVSLVDLADGHALERYGLRPRTVSGLSGVLTAPFLHRSAGHLLSDTLPFLLLGWVLMLSGLRTWLIVSAASSSSSAACSAGLSRPTGCTSAAAVWSSAGWVTCSPGRGSRGRCCGSSPRSMVVLFFGGLLSAVLPLTSDRGTEPWQLHLVGLRRPVSDSRAVLHRRARRGRRGTRRPAPDLAS